MPHMPFIVHWDSRSHTGMVMSFGLGAVMSGSWRRAPDEDDWGKLKRVLKYLYGTKHMKLCLTSDNLENISWWVDASYVVHWDSRSHTGMVISFGLGAIMSGNWRQKLNTGSSTKAERVGINDALKYIMWGLYFI